MADKTFEFCIPEDLREALQKLAKAQYRSMGHLVRDVLREYVKSVEVPHG